jgi:hypothetical protein
MKEQHSGSKERGYGGADCAERSKRGNDKSGELWSYITRTFLAPLMLTNCKLCSREYSMRAFAQVVTVTKLLTA